MCRFKRVRTASAKRRNIRAGYPAMIYAKRGHYILLDYIVPTDLAKVSRKEFMPYQLVYLDNDPKKKSKIVGSWLLDSYQEVLDTLELDYEDGDKDIYDVVITYVDESVRICLE